MKRALAERAKQSGLRNGVSSASPVPGKQLAAPRPTSSSTSSTPSATPTTPKPQPDDISSRVSNKNTTTRTDANTNSTTNKNDRTIELPTQPPKQNSNRRDASALSTSTSPTPTRTTSASPRPRKRLRESVVKLDEEDEEDSNASAFYLRHQNRALASELRTLKYETLRLERERDYRRNQTSKTFQILNALQVTWTQMESELQRGQPPEPPTATRKGDSTIESLTVAADAPASTGSGTSVELVGALLDSLASLGTIPNQRRQRIKNNDDDDSMSSADEVPNGHANPDAMDLTEQSEIQDGEQLDDLLRITDNVGKRASILQRWIWSLLRRVETTKKTASGLEDLHSVQEQVAKLKAKNKVLKAKVAELARSRDEMSSSDKRVRRGLYRLASGRVQLKEVLKAISNSDADKEAAAAWMEVAPTPSVALSTAGKIANATENDTEAKTSNEDGKVNTKEVAQLKKTLADLEQVAKSRADEIKKLLSEREEQTKRISTLLLKEENTPSDVPTDQDVQKSDLYARVMSKLATSERKVQELEEKITKMKQEWSQALANAELSRTTMEEMQSKHMKRWAEVVEEKGESSEENPRTESEAEAIITLKHKLTQALENVRQAEITRKTLEEAVSMNETLQAKLEEIRAKYGALQAGRAGHGSNSNSHASSSSSGGTSTPKAKSSSSSSSQSAEKPDRSEKSERSERTERSEKSEKLEKMHRDYRRVRKELASVTASKESAKAKLERTEKERDALNQANARLLKQATEKDEMNAKSLSTILHLKQLTEHVTKEKENLEQQVKSGQQLALAARLAANARERVNEEFEKEHKALESRLKEFEEKHEILSKEKEVSDGKLSQHSARMSALMKDVQKARDRCEELASESTKLREEKQDMMESLTIAQREASESAKMYSKLAKQASSSGGMSGFTVDQLNTQISVLKSRIACPVCNHRDKKCILLRCRHMFCKQCVDENIKNRSRKCPACGTRFDTKDVADVWL